MTGKMDVANMLSDEPPRPVRPHTAPDEEQQESQRAHQYSTRQALMSSNNQLDHQELAAQQYALSNGTSIQDGLVKQEGPSPIRHPPKSIAFELLFDGNNNERARLPMRVRIYPHDTTESIVQTVKDFYGLYAESVRGISFEDSTGETLIARYENFTNNMVVYVRIIQSFSNSWHGSPSRANSLGVTPHNAQRPPHLDAGFEMSLPHTAQVVNHGQPFSRPPSRVSRMQSLSPGTGENRRSLPASKERSRSGIKTHGDSFQAHLDGFNNEAPKYGSSDEEGASVTSSRRARNEQLASAEISEKNIVEGGRRQAQRAKFESSELPLFVPPQVPAPNSISSISPQRRSHGQDNPSPFARPPQRTFVYSQPLPSPQSNDTGENPYGIFAANNGLVMPPSGQHGHRLRDRVGAAGAIPRLSTGSAGRLAPRPIGSSILPTPDPTIASCISDEDVALQLMRFSDSAFEMSRNSGGRTSNSTMDDTLSGKADFASSVSSEDEDDDTDAQPIMPQMRSVAKTSKINRQQGNIDGFLPPSDTIEASGDEDYDDTQDNYANGFGQPAKRPKLTGSKSMMGSMKPRSQPSAKKASKASKTQQQITSRKTKPSIPHNTAKTAMSPPALPAHSRKASAASSAPAPGGLEGDDDLSTKPRCVRCRKSKKGCDRQRPCQRCKDAGIGIEGCISEDEGNGRKGRFGRHMGVPLASGGSAIETEETMGASDGLAATQEKNKKRKRPMP